MAEKDTLAKMARAIGLGKIVDAILERDKKNTKAGKKARRK